MANELSVLGLAKKAGALEIGEESVILAVRSGKARLILTASDASDRTKRHAQSLSEEWECPYVPLDHTKSELGMMVGRGSPGIISITNAGLASSFVSRLPEAGDEIKQQLAQTAERINARRKVTGTPAGGNGKRR